jgi:hypothetical protein
LLKDLDIDCLLTEDPLESAYFSDKRVKKIVSAYGHNEAEFEQIVRDPKRALAQVCEQGQSDQTFARNPKKKPF